MNLFVENGQVMEENFPKRLAESFEKLSSEKTVDAVTKRNILKDLHKSVLASDISLFRENTSIKLLENISKSLAITLLDKSEKCREISVSILNDMIYRSLILEKDFPFLINILMKSLGKNDEREKSEEIRLLEIDLLYAMIEKYENNLFSCLNDISSILSASIDDSSPEVMRKSCECLLILSSKQDSHFHMVAQIFLKPLLHAVSHHHLKTRALAVKALGAIVDCLSDAELHKAVIHLAQRLFDRSPLVRMTMTEILGQMLMTFKDRYSHFHHLIPLMLSLLYDEVPDIRSKAQDVWKQAGNQYLTENDNDYKDLIDFPRPDPIDYPDSDGRPVFGCRILVQRNIFNILPPLLRDMADWTPETRIKSSKVLYSLILHSEDKITLHLPKALDGIMCAAKADEKETVEQAIKCAELLGYFVESRHLFDSILSLIHGSTSAVHLSILAAALRGQKEKLANECMSAICKFLSDPEVSRSRKAEEQANLLLSTEALLSSGCKIDSTISSNLFAILSSISGLTINDAIRKKASDLLQNLAELQSCSKKELFKQHSIPFIKTLSENNELWTYHSSEVPIFIFVVQSECLDEEMMELIIPVLINNLHHSKEEKLRSNILFVLTSVFQNLSSSIYQPLAEKILSLVRLGIFPNLTWSAGARASMLRTVAVASLYEILNKSPIKKEMLASIGDELLPVITTSSDDTSVKTRLASCKIIEIILPELIGSVDELKIHTACYEMVRHMDDESDDIRLMTIRILKAYIKSFPSNYGWNSYRLHLKHLFENVLIHMDDKDEKIKHCVFELLKEVAFIAPEVLLDEINSKKNMMSATDLCDHLIDHIKNIKL